MRLTIVRHPNASPAIEPGYDADLARRHSEKGAQQAQARLVALGQRKYDLVLSSRAQRCIQLAALLAGIQEEEVVTLPQFVYDPPGTPDGDLMDEMFNRLGYAPLRTYLTENNLMLRLGEKAAAAIRSVARCLHKDADILIANHAVISNAIVLAMLNPNEGTVFTDFVLDTKLGECEGFALVIDKDGNVIELDIIR